MNAAVAPVATAAAINRAKKMLVIEIERFLVVGDSAENSNTQLNSLLVLLLITNKTCCVCVV